MSPDDLKKKITKKKNKCIMPVHMLEYRKYVVTYKKKGYGEDACEALGAEYFGKQVGTMGLLVLA